MSNTESAEYGHIQPGDRVRVTVEMTVETIDHWDSSGLPPAGIGPNAFTAMVYRSGTNVRGGRAIPAQFALELPESPAEGISISVERISAAN